MSSVNKVIIIGNLGGDPEVRFMPSGGAVANLSVATTSKWKDKSSGENREETEWHRLVIYGRLAEVASEYLKKGSSAYFEGRLKTRKWTDTSGADRYTTEVVVEDMRMLGGRPEQGARQAAPSRQGGYGGGNAKQGAANNRSGLHSAQSPALRGSPTGLPSLPGGASAPSSQGSLGSGFGGGGGVLDDDIPFRELDARVAY